MIYIKRFLWALGWGLVLTLGSILFLVGIFLFPPISLFYYIKNGDVETMPDKYSSDYWPMQLENVYRKLEPKLRKGD